MSESFTPRNGTLAVPDAWIDYCKSFHALFPNKPVELSPAALVAFAETIRASVASETTDSKDAARYRFLRNPARLHCITVEQFGSVRSTLHSEALDAAVDREIAKCTAA